MGDIDARLDEVLTFLGATKTRATYGAVAAIAGGSAQSIGGRLGARRPAASWVVNGSTRLPTGYAKNELHPDLTQNAEVIRSGDVLKRRLALWLSGRQGPF
ncbi:MAG: hypothetical protein AAB403_09810 [Planctomycetota bacterium]